MISILSNRNLSMESNENVLKRNNGMKVSKSINKREDKRPTILTKPSTNHQKSVDDGYEDEKKSTQPIKINNNNNNVVIKREDATKNSPSLNGYQHQKLLYHPQQNSTTKTVQSSNNSSLTVLTQQNSNIQSNTSGANVQQQPSVQLQTMASQPLPPLNQRLNTGQFLNSSVKILDENFTWQDQFQDFLLEQTDYLVVGVIGAQNVGKSTLLSLLAGNKFTDSNENMIFRPSGKDTRETAQNKTSGIQAYVTAERTILLDVQPILSSSMLEKSINTERKHTAYDFKYYENFIELQSIELVCFILTVCDVVLVAEDWYTDPNLYRVIQTAEMLMPNMHVSGGADEYVEHYPHMVYILNKSEYLSNKEVLKMKNTIDRLMCDSKLIYKGSLAEFRNHLNHKRRIHSESVNFVLIPKADGYDHDWQNNVLPEFSGLPSLDKCIKYLQREILGVKRTSFINNPMFTEKKWFAYANKVWETIKKSSMISEYNRLMT